MKTIILSMLLVAISAPALKAQDSIRKPINKVPPKIKLNLALRDSSWGKLNFLVGNWMGTGDGSSLNTKGTFSFRTDLGGEALIRKNRMIIPPAKGKPASLHEDMMVIMKNTSGVADKAVYFDNEHHIINYTITATDTSVVFLSDAVSGSPRFRLTYTKAQENNTINIKFETTSPDKPDAFTVYMSGKAVKQGK